MPQWNNGQQVWINLGGIKVMGTFVKHNVHGAGCTVQFPNGQKYQTFDFFLEVA